MSCMVPRRDGANFPLIPTSHVLLEYTKIYGVLMLQTKVFKKNNCWFLQKYIWWHRIFCFYGS